MLYLRKTQQTNKQKPPPQSFDKRMFLGVEFNTPVIQMSSHMHPHLLHVPDNLQNRENQGKRIQKYFKNFQPKWHLIEVPYPVFK